MSAKGIAKNMARQGLEKAMTKKGLDPKRLDDLRDTVIKVNGIYHASRETELDDDKEYIFSQANNRESAMKALRKDDLEVGCLCPLHPLYPPLSTLPSGLRPPHRYHAR